MLLLYQQGPPSFHQGGGCINWNTVEKRCDPGMMAIPIWETGHIQFVISCAAHLNFSIAPSLRSTCATELFCSTLQPLQ